MVEFLGYPSIDGMTGVALLAKFSLMYVIVAMTGKACLGNILVTLPWMAITAQDAFMPAFKFKIRL